MIQLFWDILMFIGQYEWSKRTKDQREQVPVEFTTQPSPEYENQHAFLSLIQL